MTETLGQVTLNPLEDLKISLRDVRGAPHVELRIYARTAPGDADGLPGGRAVVLPVRLLPELLRVLTEVKDVCIERELISLSDRWGVTPEHPTTKVGASLPNRTDSRRHPRVHLRIRVECRLLDPTTFWPGKWVAGEITDLSIGGAQVWLSERFPRFKQIEVCGVVEGTVFRERALIVGADLMNKAPKHGRHRHSLRWLEMDAHVKSALSKIVPTTVG